MRETTADKDFLKGGIFAVVAATLWGVSGTSAQFLFTQRGVDPVWLVTLRLLVAGTILLLGSLSVWRKKCFDVWRDRRSARELLIFGLIGLLPVQFTFFVAISHSNAATATVLQYLGPVFIALYFAAREKRIPLLYEIVALLLAVAGTFVLVTHGRWDSLSTSPAALFWGLTSAVGLAFYNIQPAGLLKRYEPAVIVAWGMFIGGLGCCFLKSPFAVSGVWNLGTWVNFVIVVLFGTVVPFCLYLSGIRLIGASLASILSCAEPLGAAVLSVVWLKVSFGVYDWLGTALIISTIFLLTIKRRKKNKRAAQ